MRTIDDKDIKLLKLYTIYMGYKLKYDEHSNLFYIIDGKDRLNAIGKDAEGLYVKWHKRRKDRINPIQIIEGLMRRHKENFVPLLARLLFTKTKP